MTGSTGDTRSRIQAVALELFTEQGYEKTSLREIAERLGVTKAALYYHFKSKDDIVTSFVSDRIERLDGLIEWAGHQPADAAGRRAILQRYSEEFFGDTGHTVMQFFEQNRTVLTHLSSGQMMRDRLLQMAAVLSRADPSPAGQLRATLAIFAVHGSTFALRGPDITVEQRKQLALDVAYEMLDRIGASGADEDRTALRS
ncbi:TetR/AcrR family transcriptional regulator [Plantactinospora sp. S1510]|uniref:TetR/AcrR family transcriptional regulator n=1 Tax=Plantactinospora alkalitolerans TaxID=2789879 RepID=A0ABS0GUW4_9ACTN|nr:TetR/AcrR family transcriptional regulator [Plantactinospora alkalitolerans]MBF9130001.1 TetR/AcrR family transcriptional regulator [Plantactinospora alkalitolerans]